MWSWGARAEFLMSSASRYRSSPIQLGALTNWSKVFISEYSGSTSAIKTNGTLWTWGYGTSGILGTNDRVDRSSPVQVGTDTNWSTIDMYTITSAIKTNGTLWTWGESQFGQLGGNNSTIRRSSPVQVGTDTNWSMIKCTSYHTVAIKTDGTLWAWGRNDYGQLGLNDRGVYRSSPVQVGTGTTWNGISIKAKSTQATKTDGTLWTWGDNGIGELGIPDKVARSSPVQVGSSTGWILMASNSFKQTLILKV
jgi:alpha-tubulin suppressor-like RCC1 family protein